MARKLNPELYPFRWLAKALVQRKMSVGVAAEKIGRTSSTIYNWLDGCYLKDAVFKPGQKDDVAELIACLLDRDVSEVRQQIFIFLEQQGCIPSDYEILTFRSEVAKFIEKMKNIYHLDRDTVLTSQKRELIYSVLAVMEKIYHKKGRGYSSPFLWYDGHINALW